MPGCLGARGTLAAMTQPDSMFPGAGSPAVPATHGPALPGPTRRPKFTAFWAFGLVAILWFGFAASFGTPTVCAQCTAFFQANGITFIGGAQAPSTASLPNSNYNYYNYCTVYYPAAVPPGQTSPQAIPWTTTLQTTLFRQTWVCNYNNRTNTYFPINCTWQSNITNFWNSAPNCTLAASPNTAVNPGTPVTLTATCPAGTSAPTSYTWTNASFASNATSGTVNPSTTTTYSVRGSNSFGAGSTASVTVNVNQPTLPSCTLSASPATINLGESSTLTANCNPAATSYIWTNTGFSSASASGTVSPTSTASYSVVGRNASGDSPSTPATVTVNALSEVTSSTRVNASPLSLNRVTGKYSGTFTVTNTSGSPIAGTLYIFFALPGGVTLPSLPTYGGAPYIAIPGGLAAGAATTPALLTFTNPSNARIAYTTTRFRSGN